MIKQSTFKMKVLRWAYNLIRRKYRTTHLDTFHNDIKCPNCNEWFSLSGINFVHSVTQRHEWGDTIKCGQCNHEQHWNYVAFPFPAVCDGNGDTKND